MLNYICPDGQRALGGTSIIVKFIVKIIVSLT